MPTAANMILGSNAKSFDGATGPGSRINEGRLLLSGLWLPYMSLGYSSYLDSQGGLVSQPRSRRSCTSTCIQISQLYITHTSNMFRERPCCDAPPRLTYQLKKTRVSPHDDQGKRHHRQT